MILGRHNIYTFFHRCSRTFFHFLLFLRISFSLKRILNIWKRKIGLETEFLTFPHGQLKRKIVVLDKEVNIFEEDENYLSKRLEFISLLRLTSLMNLVNSLRCSLIFRDKSSVM